MRSVVEHESEHHFESAWASATASTKGAAPALTFGEAQGDPQWTVGQAIGAFTLPEATGGTGAITYSLDPATWNGVSFDATTRAMSGTPGTVGTQAFTYTATDESGAMASLTFTATASATDTESPTLALALADGVEAPVSDAFGITVTFSESVTGFGLDDLVVAHGATSEVSGSGASYTATVTPEEGYAGDLTVDIGAGAAVDATGNTSAAATTLTVSVTPPVTKPDNVANATDAETAWKTMDLIFDAPPAGSDWVASKSELRVLGMKNGARRTGWRSFKTTSVEDGQVHASTGAWLAIGRVYEVEVRWCGASSAVACSEASDRVYGASPASAPVDAEASATAPASETALKLAWSIPHIRGKKNLQAAYEMGWSADTDASEPETLLAEVPAFGTKEATVDGLEAGAAYRLFVRSVIDWQGARLFASNWTSAVATTASEAQGLAQEALKRELARQARVMLEDASAVIGNRMADGRPGADALTAFAGILGSGQRPGDCPLTESLEDCMTGAPSGDVAGLFGPTGFGATSTPFDLDSGRQVQTFGFAELRERLKGGFAVSLNQPLPSANGLAQDASTLDQGVHLTFWGQGAPGFSTSTMFWGLDAMHEKDWMAGFAFADSALSRGETRISGFAESEVTAVYPYARGELASGLELWSLAGWGQGSVDSLWTGFSSLSGPQEVIELYGDLAFSMGLAGAEQRLYEREGFSLSVLGDAGWSRLGVEGGTADGVSATVHRTRAALEGRYAGNAWTSSVRFGARVDGGDGDTASGTELSGDMRRTWGRWETGLQGRWYAAETIDLSAQAAVSFGEQGVRGALGMRAREDGTGLAFTVSPGWGMHASQEVGLLDAFGGDAGGEAAAPTAYLDGRVSWGTRINGLVAPRETLRPWAELSLSGEVSHIRTGLALEGPLRTSVAVERRESDTGPAEHGLMLRLDTRF